MFCMRRRCNKLYKGHYRSWGQHNGPSVDVTGRLSLSKLNTNTNKFYIIGSRGHAVVWLVEALRCKPEGCGFDS
jgi:hypothetical protein